AFLGGADLQGAFLIEANLEGAFLWEADLQGALMCNTILPAGMDLDPDRDCDLFGR
ncbi:MAG: pentapeptide repeat-containing protein, partial [Cyanobacteria bacterium]|nr:pentapeptide repeat-containing protein [Cyanobacteriota bacterium]